MHNHVKNVHFLKMQDYYSSFETELHASTVWALGNGQKKKRKVDSMDKNAKEFDVMNESSWEKEVIIAMMSIKPPANNNPFHSTPTKGHIFLPFS